MTGHADLAIVGGGPVGAALALALRDSGLAIVLLEARREFAARDPRAIALSHGGRLILDRLGVWPRLAPKATAIEAIHVSQRGGFGHALLEARELGVPALGYTAEYGDLYAALAAHLSACGARIVAGARVTAVEPASGCGLVSFEQDGAERQLTARLIVQADGGRSLPGERAEKDYGQSAVVCAVRSERLHRHRAYERFTAEGPLALLPLDSPSPPSPLPPAGEGRYAVVWTAPAGLVEQRLGLDDAAFLAELHQAFGERQGAFLEAGPRAAFPLRLVTSAGAERPGLVRIGNAAQILHPVAGQGFNLGLRDAWALARLLLDCPREVLGSADFLARYRANRQWDVSANVGMTEMLVGAFSNDLPGLAQARGLALTALDALPPLKRLFARKMMFGAQAW